MTAGTLIVGASQAGLQVATSLRDLGYDEPITFVGAEGFLPYQRPPLSKSFLLGGMESEDLAFRNERFYPDHKIDLHLSTRIVDITWDDLEGVAISQTGRDYRFDRLALTTGARVRRLPCPGAELRGVAYLRDMRDALALRAAFGWAKDVVVVGGGFIGLEAAAVSCKQGRNVTVVETLPSLFARVGEPVVADFYIRAHERRGVNFRLGTGVSEIVGEQGAVRGVRLTDGSVVPADLVVVGIGVLPRSELAEKLGLTCQGGAILVDEFAATTRERTVAAGDCAVGPHPLSRGEMVRIESVQNAVDQAKTAAATLLDKQEPYTAVPWFWSDQGDLKLQMAGLSAGHDHHVVRGSLDEEKFSILYYRQGRLIAITSINRAPDYIAARNILTQGKTVNPVVAADVSVPLKQAVEE